MDSTVDDGVASEEEGQPAAVKYFLGQVIFWTRVVIRAMWCMVMIVTFVIAYFGLIVLPLPLRWIWPRLWWGYEGKLYRWLMACVGYWGYTSGYDIIEYGDDLSDAIKERCLVICNHQSTADVPVLASALQTKGTATRKLCWIMAGMFKWSPFGLISQVHGDHFIWEGKNIRDRELENIKKHLWRTYWDRDRWWVMLFPEGGFLYKRRVSSQTYAQKYGYPHLEHVTLPRTGAFRSVLQAIGPREPGGDAEAYLDSEGNLAELSSLESDDENGGDVRSKQRSRSASNSSTRQRTAALSPPNGETTMTKRPSALKLVRDTVGAIREKKYIKETRPPLKYVLDVTIGYTNGEALSADQLWFGTRRECEDIHVYYKLYDINTVPFDTEEKCRDWLYARYVEKEKMLDHFYKTGEMVAGEYGRRLHFPLPKIFAQYLFWFTMVYVHYRVYGSIVRWMLAAIGL